MSRNPELDAMLFIAIDKGSPYDLKSKPTTNSLEKLEGFTFEDLHIVTGFGTKIVWLWINAHIKLYGGEQVADVVSSKVKDVDGLIKAVYDTVKVTP